MLRLLLALVLLFPASARAGDALDADAPAGTSEPQPVPPASGGVRPRRGHHKSPTKALMLSLVPTLAGGTLIAIWVSGVASPHPDMWEGYAPAIGGLGVAVALVGPTLGHAWSGRTWNRGLALRLVGTPVMAIGAGTLAFGLFQRDGGDLSRTGIAVAVVGAAVYAAGMIDEIASAPRAARAHNRGLDAKLTIAPIITPDTTTAGLALAGRF